MPVNLKLLAAMSLIAVLGACNTTTAGDTVTNAEAAEAALDGVDLDGDGKVDDGGVEVGQVN